MFFIGWKKVMGYFKTGHRHEILLVERNKENANQLKEILASQFEITETTSENDALSLLQDGVHDFSIVIIDIQLSISILKVIRSLSTIENIPVLITTEGEYPDLEDELLEFGVIDFLKYPYNEKRVVNRIRTTLKLVEVNNEIYELERDELTGLYTRQAFLHKAELIIRNNPQKRFCIIAFDFYNFKTSNSLYGEKKCNDFLAYTARMLRNAMPDGISGRFGGDQYILFYEYKEKVDVDRLIRIKQNILDTAPIPRQIVKIGVYAPVDAECPMILCCDRAFLALSQIKGIYGKDIAFYEDSLQQQLLDEQRISETMERGLVNEEFRVFYQPKHEAITGKIAGAEALVRWEHPEYGFLAPSHFIPLFERNGFISKLDLFIISQVCKDIKRWQDNGFPLVPVSVNVSRHDLLEDGWLENLFQTIDSYNIDHSLLHMEVTESLYTEKTDVIISQVKRTQEMGFMIEMDDFGSGYSSLGMLSSFPLDILKLDISFVKNIKANEVVIESVIKMAHKLGLLTVAEGAESSEQFRMLKSLGCDFIQGFYFSKPLPVYKFEDYLKKTTVMTMTNNNDERSLFETEANSTKLDLSENMLLAANEVAESFPGGYFSCHADGDFEIVAFNKTIMKMFDCTSAEEFRKHTNNNFTGLVLPEDYDSVVKSIKTQVATGSTICNIDFRTKTRNGTIKYLHSIGRRLHTEKYGDIYYVFVTDVTEEKTRKEIEEKERIQKDDLVRAVENVTAASQAKNVFMLNMAKDILSPMRRIIEYTEKMQNNIENADLIKKNLAKAKQSEEYMLNFINNVLEFSRLETDAIHVTETPSDISHAVERIYEIIKDTVERNKIKVEYSSEISYPYVYQDLFLTTDVVMNIVMNAIKYTPKGGTIKYSIKQIPVNDDECIVEFLCEDTGIGISEEFLPKIYDEFLREDNEINRKNGSSGLGLNVTKKLMNLMGGTIEITSQQGKGTVVKTTQKHRYAKASDISGETTLADNMNE